MFQCEISRAGKKSPKYKRIRFISSGWCCRMCVSMFTCCQQRAAKTNRLELLLVNLGSTLRASVYTPCALRAAAYAVPWRLARIQKSLGSTVECISTCGQDEMGIKLPTLTIIDHPVSFLNNVVGAWRIIPACYNFGPLFSYSRIVVWFIKVYPLVSYCVLETFNGQFLFHINLAYFKHLFKTCLKVWPICFLPCWTSFCWCHHIPSSQQLGDQ